MYQVLSSKYPSEVTKIPNTKYLIPNTQKGFSPLFILLPVALIFVVTVFLLQGPVGQRFLNQPVPTAAPLDQSSNPQLDDQSCNDPYNADCFVGDDEGDNVKPEDLIGPD